MAYARARTIPTAGWRTPLAGLGEMIEEAVNGSGGGGGGGGFFVGPFEGWGGSGKGGDGGLWWGDAGPPAIDPVALGPFGPGPPAPLDRKNYSILPLVTAAPFSAVPRASGARVAAPGSASVPTAALPVIVPGYAPLATRGSPTPVPQALLPTPQFQDQGGTYSIQVSTDSGRVQAQFGKQPGPFDNAIAWLKADSIWKGVPNYWLAGGAALLLLRRKH